MNAHSQASFREWESRFGGQGRGAQRVRASLAKTEKGEPLNTLGNLLVILAHDPALTGMVGFNEFTSQPLLMRPPPPMDDDEAPLPGPYPRPWGVEDVALVLTHVQRNWIPKARTDAIEQAMLTEAAHRRFHPIRNWLASLKWDGKPRVDTWLCKAFGTPDDDYHRAIGSKFLIAAVRRIRHPGCKFDHMPVLEGDQGIGKSTACRTLFTDEWFSDAIPEELASRDAAMALLGVWVLEFSEIQHLIRNEVEVIKAFLSRAVDRYRPPYGKAYVDRPRQGVLIGTTNTNDYLRDSSGNRRIWPIRCQFADAEWIAANRVQLWAEAAAREAANEAIWLDDDNTRKEAAEHQADRMTDDSWTDPVAEWLAGRVEVRIADVLSSALSIPKDRQGKREQMRAGDVMRSLGWERQLVRQQGKAPARLWRKTAK